MKNRILFMLSLAFLVMSVIGCTTDNAIIDESTSEDLIAIRPVPTVDLSITSYTTNITPTSTNCGALLPDVSCAGQRGFLASVVILNSGPFSLPAGSLSVDWTDVTPAGSSTQRQTIPHGGIAAGGTFTFTRPYWMGPCDCPPPGGNYFTHTFFAQVDPANLIPESNENNNFSISYVACDGC